MYRALFLAIFLICSNSVFSNILFLIDGHNCDNGKVKLEFVSDFRDRYFSEDSVIYVIRGIRVKEANNFLLSRMKVVPERSKIVVDDILYEHIERKFSTGFLINFGADTVSIHFEESYLPGNLDHSVEINEKEITLSKGARFFSNNDGSFYIHDAIYHQLYLLGVTGSISKIDNPLDSAILRDIALSKTGLYAFFSRPNSSPDLIYEYRNAKWKLLMEFEETDPELVPVTAFYSNADSFIYSRCRDPKDELNEFKLCRISLTSRRVDIIEPESFGYRIEAYDQDNPSDFFQPKFFDDSLIVLFMANQLNNTVYSLNGPLFICIWLKPKPNVEQLVSVGVFSLINQVKRVNVNDWRVSINAFDVNRKALAYTMVTNEHGKPKELWIESLEGIVYNRFSNSDSKILVRYSKEQDNYSIDYYKK
ncbi:MAG: hypothetical protein ABIV51_01055 [Saprospiraceae bacterium]